MRQELITLRLSTQLLMSHKNNFLLVDSVGNKEVEGKIVWKHLLKVLGKFPKGSSITAMVFFLQL